MTLRISGSQYVTSNSFFSEISDLHCMIKDWKNSSDLSVHTMGINMRTKFDKYWGDPQKINTLNFIFNILDPRDKIEYMEFFLKEIYSEIVVLNLYNIITNDLNLLFEDYFSIYGSSTSSIVFGTESDSSCAGSKSELAGRGK